jgi:hypothetical protein
MVEPPNICEEPLTISLPFVSYDEVAASILFNLFVVDAVYVFKLPNDALNPAGVNKSK